MEAETEERTKPIAIFMAFGTKGDVYPIAAIAAAFACDQRQYSISLIIHSAQENLGHHLAEKHVAYYPISSPPVCSADQNNETTTGLAGPVFLLGSASLESSFSLLHLREIEREETKKQKCHAERLGCCPDLRGFSGFLLKIILVLLS